MRPQTKSASSRATATTAVWLALAGRESAVGGVETTLGRPGVGDHLGRLTLEPLAAFASYRRRMPVGPSRLHEHATDVPVARLGDGTLVPTLPARVLQRGETGKGRVRTGGRETAEVRGLGHDGERRKGVQAAQDPQAGDASLERLREGELLDAPPTRRAGSRA